MASSEHGPKSSKVRPAFPGRTSRQKRPGTMTTGSTANVVAVLDTGVDYTHPDLAANIWRAPASFRVSIDGADIVCAAGTHRFNAIAKTYNPLDDHDHGTHVAGIIEESGNNGVSVTGVNWTTRILPVKVLDATGTGIVADAIAAIEFLIRPRAPLPRLRGPMYGCCRTVGVEQGFRRPCSIKSSRANDHGMLFVPGFREFRLSERACPHISCELSGAKCDRGHARQTTPTTSPGSPTMGRRSAWQRRVWTSCGSPATTGTISAGHRWPQRMSPGRRRWCSPSAPWTHGSSSP